MSISSTSNTLSSPSSRSSANSTPQPVSLRATPSISSSSQTPSPIIDCESALLAGENDNDADNNIFKTKTRPVIVIKQELTEQVEDERATASVGAPSNHVDKRSDKLPSATAAPRHTITNKITTSTNTSLVQDSCHNRHEKLTPASSTTAIATSSFISSLRPNQSVSIVGAGCKRPPAGGKETVTSATPTILKKVAPIQPVAKLKDVALSGASARGAQLCGPVSHQHQQQTANRWKLGSKLEATCNILSKSSIVPASKSAPSSSSSSISSRPDLVASSLSSLSSSSSPASAPSLASHSASQLVNFKTLPLLIQHNHPHPHPQPHHHNHHQQQQQHPNHHNNQFQTSNASSASSGKGNTGSSSTNITIGTISNSIHVNNSSSSASTDNGGKNCSESARRTSSNAQANATRPLISTLTPQIILSQIITASPVGPQRASHHHSAITSANLDGLQLCLTSAANSQTSTSVLQVTSAEPGVSSVAKQTSAFRATVQPAASSGSPSKQSREQNTDSRHKTAKLNSSASGSNNGVAPTITTINSNSDSNSNSNSNSSSSNNNNNNNNTNNGNKNSNSDKSVEPAPSGSQEGAGSNIAAARLLDLGKRLLEAAREGKLDLVRHLIEDAGAPFTSDWLGTTALHLAAQGGHQDVAEVLVRAGVNRDARTKLERTALHLAAQSGSLEIVDLLLTHGSDVNARDMLKMTPLHWAVERGHVYVAERLLISGADSGMSNKFLLTPTDIARELGSYEMIELFKNWTGAGKDDQNLEAYGNDPGGSLNESQDFLDIDYHLALVDSATANNRAGDLGDKTSIGEPCIDLVEFEWNKLDFDPDLFFPDDSPPPPPPAPAPPTNEMGDDDDDEAEDDDDDDDDDEDDDEVEGNAETRLQGEPGEGRGQKVDLLMKVVEDLKRENQLLRQKVEQLSTVDE